MSRVHIFGNHVDTDVIIPARYLNVSDPKELAKYCMQDADPTFTENVKVNDVIVGGYNFGCGSSREHAPIAIKAVGIQCVIAKSFARIFFRNAFNIGLPVIESEEIVDDVNQGDEIEVDYETGVVINKTQKKAYTITKFPDFMMAIINKGGLVPFTKEVINHD